MAYQPPNVDLAELLDESSLQETALEDADNLPSSGLNTPCFEKERLSFRTK